MDFWLPGNLKLDSFIFTPAANSPAGTPDRCEVDVFRNNRWEKVAEAEFSNIKANPIPQVIPMNGVQSNRVRIRFTRMIEDSPDVVFSELGVVPQ